MIIMFHIIILGSTGSVGKIALSIVKRYPKNFKIIALVANSNIQLIYRQCIEFSPKYVMLNDIKSSEILRKILKDNHCSTEVLFGLDSLEKLSNISSVDYVISAITGIAGLIPTISFIRKGRKILLANKESLVSCGKIFFDEVKKYQSQILPIDSEINAIFQMLPKEFHTNLGFFDLTKIGIDEITLTGSGGPFLTTPISELKSVTPKEACRHPNWSMGKKISVDSATMINKGFEYVETRYCFNIEFDQINILIHPQSIVHSMIHYVDGSIVAKLGIPDMTASIHYSMFYPFQYNSKIYQKKLNLKKTQSLTFIEPDYKRYPCLKLAMEVSRSEKQSVITALNAINEVAVSAFLSGKIKFTDIFNVNDKILEKVNFQEPNNIEEIIYIDFESRNIAKRYIDLCN